MPTGEGVVLSRLDFRPGYATNGTAPLVAGAVESAAASAFGFNGTGAVCAGSFRASSLGRGPDGVPGTPLSDWLARVASGERAGSLQAHSKTLAEPKSPTVIDRIFFIFYRRNKRLLL